MQHTRPDRTVLFECIIIDSLFDDAERSNVRTQNWIEYEEKSKLHNWATLTELDMHEVICTFVAVWTKEM